VRVQRPTHRVRFRRALGTGIVLFALGGVTGNAHAAGTFDDDDYDRHEPNIEAVAAAGITEGCRPGEFCPSQRVNRGQMASFLVRALNLPPATRDHFTDDDGTTHEASINAVAEAGITGGCAPGRYCPNREVTRGQMASFLARARGLDPIPVGPYLLVGPVHGRIDEPGRVNTHTFEVGRPSRITYENHRCPDGSGNRVGFIVTDGEGRVIAQWSDWSSREIFSVPRAGRYTMTTRTAHSTRRFNYCFTLIDVTTPQRFQIGIGQFVTPTGPNGPQPQQGAGNIGQPGEIDVYTFEVGRPSRITYENQRCPDGSGNRVGFIVTDEEGRVIAQWSDWSSREIFSVPRAGRYTMTTRTAHSTRRFNYCFTLIDVTDTNPQ
jgi:hypothetical protein